MHDCSKHILPAPAGSKPVYFSGVPDHCDLCGGAIHNGEFFADAEIPASGQWAFLCPACITDQQLVFGWGKGQLYQKQAGDPAPWLLVAGHPESVDDMEGENLRG